MLGFEKYVHDFGGAALAKCSIPEDMLVSFNDARTALSNKLKDVEKSYKAVSAVLTQMSDRLIELDPSFKLEIEFFKGLSSTIGQQFWCDRLAEFMPNAEKEVSISQVAVGQTYIHKKYTHATHPPQLL